MRYAPEVAVLILTLGLLSTASAAEKPDPKTLRNVAEAYLARRPAAPPPVGLPYERALASQQEYLEILGTASDQKLGSKAGYKVGLVTPAGQQRHDISHPVRGVLFEKMLLPNHSRVPAAYGTRPIVEPDLMVRVKDAGINDARTLEEAAQHLSEVICFIELADATFRTNAPVDAGVLVACNVGARAGIVGESRQMQSSRAFLDAFGKMSLVFQERDGQELSRVTADGVMGHPLNAVLWLVKDLKSNGGEKLKAGDVISLGSPSPAVSPQAGDQLSLVYEGLPGGPLRASVQFE